MKILIIGPFSQWYIKHLLNFLITFDSNSNNIEISVISFSDEQKVNVTSINENYSEYSTIYKLLHKANDNVKIKFFPISKNKDEEAFSVPEYSYENLLSSFFITDNDRQKNQIIFANKYKQLISKLMEMNFFTDDENDEVFIAFQPCENSFSISQVVKSIFALINKKTGIHIDLNCLTDLDEKKEMEEYLHESCQNNKDITLFTFLNPLTTVNNLTDHSYSSFLGVISLLDYKKELANRTNNHFTYSNTQKVFYLNDFPYLYKNFLYFIFFIYMLFYVSFYKRNAMRCFVHRDNIDSDQIDIERVEYSFLIDWMNWISNAQNQRSLNIQFNFFNLKQLFSNLTSDLHSRLLNVNPLCKVGDMLIHKEYFNKKLLNLNLYKFLKKGILESLRGKYMPENFYAIYLHLIKATNIFLNKL